MMQPQVLHVAPDTVFQVTVLFLGVFCYLVWWVHCVVSLLMLLIFCLLETKFGSKARSSPAKASKLPGELPHH